MVKSSRRFFGSFTPLLCAALGACLGFYLFGSLSTAVIYSVLFAALVNLCFFRVLAYKKLSVYSTVFAVGLCIGICAQTASVNIVSFGIPQEKITGLSGVLLEDPRVISRGSAMAVMSLRQSAGEKGLRVSASGEITVFFTETNALKIREFGRGTTVFIEGSLDGEKNTFSARAAHVVKPASAIERMRTGVRLNLIERFEGKQWGGLALALLVGIRDNLDTNLTTLYRSAGLSYILALSGMHLAVLAALIAFLLRKPLGLKAAAITGAVIICLYCFIVGPMPSLNRAALMYLLGVLAVLGALPKESLSVLALSFLIQIVITPSAGNTVSFILSYLAMLGILIIAKALVSLFAGKMPDCLLQPLSISCGAFIATAGVTSFCFGILAPAGIIASLIIVPATTAFMIGAIAWLVLDLFSISFILNLPLSLLYKLMEKTAFFTGQAPGITASRPFVILMISILLMALIVVQEYKLRVKRIELREFL
jgi:competence protein ComEC